VVKSRSFLGFGAFILVVSGSLGGLRRSCGDGSFDSSLRQSFLNQARPASEKLEKLLGNVQGDFESKIAKTVSDGRGQSNVIQTRSSCEYCVSAGGRFCRISLEVAEPKPSAMVSGFRPDYDFEINRVLKPDSYTVSKFEKHSKSDATPIVKRMWDAGDLKSSLFGFENVRGDKLADLAEGIGGSLVGIELVNRDKNDLVQLTFNRQFTDGKELPLIVTADQTRDWAVTHYIQQYPWGRAECDVSYRPDFSTCPIPSKVNTKLIGTSGNILQDITVVFGPVKPCQIGLDDCSLEAYGLPVPGSMGRGGKAILWTLTALAVIAAVALFRYSRAKSAKG
jgi:hypothetical protein